MCKIETQRKNANHIYIDTGYKMRKWYKNE